MDRLSRRTLIKGTVAAVTATRAIAQPASLDLGTLPDTWDVDRSIANLENAREQLEQYPNVETREAHVEEVTGKQGDFSVRLSTGPVSARRLLLCTGMIDEIPPIDGMRELWGTSVFQCPYCHGWEVQDRRFGYLAGSVEMLEFPLLLRGWTRDVVLLTDGKITVPEEVAARLSDGGIDIEQRPIQRLVGDGDHLTHIEFAGGDLEPYDVLLARPPQRQVDLVRSLGLALDPKGFVRVDEMHRETSIPGIYAAGDLTSPGQGALFAAADGTRAAGMLNHALTVELANHLR
jgi:thioredoxin reductase